MSNSQYGHFETPENSSKKPSHWQTETLFFDGDKYFQALAAAIDAAKHEILVESYIYDMDTVGLRILYHLEAAVGRGVTVRILVDGIGSYNWLTELRYECRKRKLLFRVYHPLPFRLNLMRRISWKRLRRLLTLFRRINKRNHRKTITIDQEKAFLGSFNISQVHSKKMMGLKAWRDSGVFVQGSSVIFLRQDFLRAWSKSKFESLSGFSENGNLLRRKALMPKNSLIRLNSRIRWRYSLLRDLNFRMKSAQKRILITNGYFLPRQSVLRGLKKAARRGVFVGLCIPAKSDIWFVKAAAKSLYLRLINAGVHIYEYQPTILHAKTLIIDDWATVGSHNLNHRSLVHDLEVEAVLTSQQSIAELIQQWDADVKNSLPISKKDLGKIGLWQQFLSRFAYWFRYWI